MLVKEIEDLISIKICSGELGDESESEEEQEMSSNPLVGGNTFRSIEDLVEESAAVCGIPVPSPRSVAKKNPTPRKSRGPYQYMEDFNSHFSVLVGAIVSSLKQNEGPPTSVKSNEVTDLHLEKINSHLEAIDNRFDDVNKRLDHFKLQFGEMKQELQSMKHEIHEMKDMVILAKF